MNYSESERINIFKEAAILERKYFAKGKLLYNWWKLFFTHVFCQQNQIVQGSSEMTLNIKFDKLIKIKIRQGQRIVLGSLKEILGTRKFQVCDIVNSKLCKCHFTVTMSPNYFDLLWAKYLRSKLGGTEIKLKIARFVGFGELEIVDISDSHYQSFIQTKGDQKQLILRRKQMFCLEENNDSRKSYLTFAIKQLKNEIDFNLIIKKRLLVLGTERDEIINEQIFNLLECPESVESILQDELKILNQSQKRAILLKSNSSFIQILLFPDFNPNGTGNQLNLDYQLEIKKYESILQKLQYENGNWWIQKKKLLQEIEKKKKISITNQKIVTISNSGVQEIEIYCSKNE